MSRRLSSLDATFLELEDALGGTVNDVVLAVAASGLRRLPEERGDELPEHGLRAAPATTGCNWATGPARSSCTCPCASPTRGAGIAVASHAGRVFFGLSGDARAAPDLNVLRDGIEDSLAELRGIARHARRTGRVAAH